VSALYDDPWFYDLQHDGYRADLGFYRRLVQDQAGSVLELGAGTGRVTLALAGLGHDVVAVEPSDAMRQRGEERLAQARAEARSPEARAALDRVRFVAGDARTLALDERFALVIAPFNTLMHLERLDDQDAALRVARAHLAPGGAFACDVFVPRFGPDGVVRVEPVWTPVGGARADLFLWQHHDPVAQLIVSEHRLDERADDGRLTRRSATLRQRYFQRFELERALAAAGFRDVRSYGDFERGPVRATSEVWCFIARA